MVTPDLIINSHRSMSSLQASIRAFVDFAGVIPDDDRFSSLCSLLAARIQSDFEAAHLDAVILWASSDEEKAEERGRAATTTTDED